MTWKQWAVTPLGLVSERLMWAVQDAVIALLIILADGNPAIADVDHLHNIAMISFVVYAFGAGIHLATFALGALLIVFTLCVDPRQLVTPQGDLWPAT